MREAPLTRNSSPSYRRCSLLAAAASPRFRYANFFADGLATVLVPRVHCLMPRRVSVLVAFVSALAFAQEEPYGDAPTSQIPDIDGRSEYGDRTWDYIKLSEEDMELFNLCESNTSGTPAQIRDVLERGASPSVQGEYNYTALMWTAVRGKTEQARILLEAGADTETINAWGRNALFIAAWEKRNGIVEAMIEYGANVSACAEHDEWNALHKACEMGNHKMVAMLLAAGVRRLLIEPQSCAALPCLCCRVITPTSVSNRRPIRSSARCQRRRRKGLRLDTPSHRWSSPSTRRARRRSR